MAAELSWELHLKQLRDIEKLLARVYTREQLVATCIDRPEDAEPFRTWSAKISGLRWEVITKFCSEATRCDFDMSESVGVEVDCRCSSRHA